MNKANQSQLVRDGLIEQIKQLNSTGLPKDSKEKIIEQKTKQALFKLGEIWIADIPFK